MKEGHGEGSRGGGKSEENSQTRSVNTKGEERRKENKEWEKEVVKESHPRGERKAGKF